MPRHLQEAIWPVLACYRQGSGRALRAILGWSLWFLWLSGRCQSCCLHGYERGAGMRCSGRSWYLGFVTSTEQRKRPTCLVVVKTSGAPALPRVGSKKNISSILPVTSQTVILPAPGHRLWPRSLLSCHHLWIRRLSDDLSISLHRLRRNDDRLGEACFPMSCAVLSVVSMNFSIARLLCVRKSVCLNHLLVALFNDSINPPYDCAYTTNLLFWARPPG
jgi:hypothetical protein